MLTRTNNSAGELSQFIILKLRKTHSHDIVYKLFVPNKALSEGLSLCFENSISCRIRLAWIALRLGCFRFAFNDGKGNPIYTLKFPKNARRWGSGDEYRLPIWATLVRFLLRWPVTMFTSLHKIFLGFIAVI